MVVVPVPGSPPRPMVAVPVPGSPPLPMVAVPVPGNPPLPMVVVPVPGSPPLPIVEDTAPVIPPPIFFFRGTFACNLTSVTERLVPEVSITMGPSSTSTRLSNNLSCLASIISIVCINL